DLSTPRRGRLMRAKRSAAFNLLIAVTTAAVVGVGALAASAQTNDREQAKKPAAAKPAQKPVPGVRPGVRPPPGVAGRVPGYPGVRGPAAVGIPPGAQQVRIPPGAVVPGLPGARFPGGVAPVLPQGIGPGVRPGFAPGALPANAARPGALP